MAALLLSTQILAIGAAFASDTTLVAAVVPGSRSIQIGTTATTFATIINPGTVVADNCFIAPAAAFIGDFQYQTTDPATNAPIGSINSPTDIAAGAAQTFVLALRPTAAMDADVAFTFGCQNAASATTRSSGRNRRCWQ